MTKPNTRIRRQSLMESVEEFIDEAREIVSDFMKPAPKPTGAQHCYVYVERRR